MSKTPYSGMGAIVGPEGVTFRVWAPHAEKVFITGSFNDWDDNIDEMEHEDDGYWAFHHQNAKVNDEYKFAIQTPTGRIQKSDPYALKMTHSNGNSVVFDLYEGYETHDYEMPSLNKLVIYELHVGTFNREGLEENQVGNFYKAAEKLDYLKSLGINAVEIMPVMEFPGDHSWGYNPSFPFSVEGSYGGPEGLRHFVFESHIRGIAVIMDVVYNHFGPDDLDLWQFDGWQENDLGGIYFYNDHRAKTPWGNNRPDYGRKEVRNYLRDNAMMWLKGYQCDALRFDATAIIRLLEGDTPDQQTQIEEGFQFLQSLTEEIKRELPGKILIAEDLKMDPIVTLDTQSGGLGFHSQWGTGFSHEIKRLLLEFDEQNRSLDSFTESIFKTFNADSFQRVIFTESHDEVANGSSRLPEEIQPGKADGEFAKKKSVLGAIALFTAPGIPMIFQGQEFLSDGYFTDDIPLDWSRSDIFDGLKNLYSDLIHLRLGLRDESIGLTGSLTALMHLNNESSVMAFTRTHGDHLDRPVLVILNFSAQSHQGYRIGAPSGGNWKVRFNSSWKGYDEEFAEMGQSELSAEGGFEDFPHSLLFDISAFSGLILTY